MAEQKKDTVYLNIHKSFVNENLVNKETKQNFNLVNLPSNVFIKGLDVGGSSWSPLFINKKPIFGEDNQPVKDENGNFVIDENSPMRSIPCLPDQPIWLRRDGEVIAKVAPDELKNALEENRKQYLEQKHTQKQEQEKPAKTEIKEELATVTKDEPPFEMNEKKEAPVKENKKPVVKNGKVKRPSPTELISNAEKSVKANKKETKTETKEKTETPKL